MLLLTPPPLCGNEADMDFARAVQLRYFTRASLLREIGLNRLARLRQDFEPDLKDAEYLFPVSKPEDVNYFSDLAAAFARTDQLPGRLRDTLFMIEAIASPENRELLESTTQRRIPCIAVNRSCAIDWAMEIWFACPDELPNFLPRNGHPEFEIEQPASSTSNPAHRIEQRDQQPSTFNLPPSTNGSTDISDPERNTQNSKLHSNSNSVDGKLLLDDLARILSRFVILPKYVPEALALWIVHTYAFKLRDVSVYIGIESPEKRCGKTTLLTVLAELAHNAIAASNISPPAFFRVIEDLSPTLLIDEADTFLNSNDALRGILNAGYKKKTAFVLRAANDPSSSESEPNSQNSKIEPAGSQCNSFNPVNSLDSETIRHSSGGIRHFSSWCPKAIATIDRLPDTLADRCILIRMHRKARNEECEWFRNLDAKPLRQQCARFAHEHAQKIATAAPELPRDLSDRAAEIWEPLLALADLARGDWPHRARQAALHLSAAAQQSSPISSLLLDIYVGFVVAKTERLLTRDIVQHLNAFTDRPWMESLRGKAATDRWLSQQLSPYGIKPRLLRIGDNIGRGYVLNDFNDTLRRYASKAEFRALYPKEPPDEPKPTSDQA